MLEKLKKIVDDGGVFGALLTNLFKAFDCIPHHLIISKLEAYCFHIDALKLIHDHLSNRKRREKLMMHIARGRIYFMVFHRDPYSVLYYSIQNVFFAVTLKNYKLCYSKMN